MTSIRAGNRVAILTNPEELENILDCYTTSDQDVFPDARQLVGKVCTVVSTPKIMSNAWDGLVDLRFSSSGAVYRLPYAVIDADRDVNENEEDGEEPEMVAEPDEILIVRDRPSEAAMIRQLAVETIQEAYRRYRECKPDMKSRKITSNEHMVMTLAAETIKNNLKKVMSKRKHSRDSVRSTTNNDSSDEKNDDKENKHESKAIFGPLQTTTLELITETSSSMPSSPTKPLSVKKGTWNGSKWELHDLNLEIPVVADEKSSPPPSHSRKAERDRETSPISRRLFQDTKVSLDMDSPLRDDKKGTTPVLSPMMSVSGHRFNGLLSPPQSPISSAQAKAQGKASHKSQSLEPSPLRFNSTKTSPIRPPMAPIYVLDENDHDYSKDYVRLSSSGPMVAPSKSSPSFRRGREREINREMNTKEFKSKAGIAAATKIAEVHHQLRVSTNMQLSSGVRPSSVSTTTSRQYVSDMIANRSEMIATATASSAAVNAAARISSTTTISHQHQNTTFHKDSKRTGSAISNTTTGPRLVVDEAFHRSMNKCTVIRLLPHEVAMILDALGYKLTDHACYLFSSPKRKTGQHEAQPSDFVSLPLLGPAPLAAALCKIVRRHHFVENSHVFSISEKHAQVALIHLKSLLEGPWIHARQIVLSATNRGTKTQNHGGGNGRSSSGNGGAKDGGDGDHKNEEDEEGGQPSQWGVQWIKRFAGESQFPSEYFSHCPGKDFLGITRQMAKTDFGIMPSLLQERFVVYQRTLQTLEDWWSLGLRPTDPYKDSFHQLVDSNRFTYETPHEYDEHHRMDQSIVGNDVSVMDGTNMISTEQQYIEIASSTALLHEWIPLNRANGWGAPLEILSAISGLIGGICGRLLSSVSDGRTSDAPLPSSISSIGCQWVQIWSIDVPDCKDNTLRVEIQDAIKTQSLSSCVNFVADTISSLSLLIPLSCIHTAPRDAIFGMVRRDRNVNLDLTITGLVVGTHVMVVGTEAVLLRAFERFDWWDRPNAEVLKNMIGKKCEIVSVAELYDGTKKRVGVRILGTNVVDALPVEVLLPFVTSPKMTVSAETTAIGSSTAIPVIENMTTIKGGKTNKKDGQKKMASASTGGTKLREKYAKHKQDKKHNATTGISITHGDNRGAVKTIIANPLVSTEETGHHGKMYVYDMPPPIMQSSPGPLIPQEEFDEMGMGVGKKVVGQPLFSRPSLSPSKDHRMTVLPTATTDDIRLLETRGINIASPITAPCMTTSSGRPLYRPQSAPSTKPNVNIKLTSESLKKLEMSLLSSSPPHHHYHPHMIQDPHSRGRASLDLTNDMDSNPQILQNQTYSETVVVPKVCITKRNTSSQPIFDEEFVVEDLDDDDDESGNVPPPDYSWLRGAANKLNGSPHDRMSAEYGNVGVIESAPVVANDTKRVIPAQPTLSFRQHEFAWTNGTTATTTSQPPRNKVPMKGRPSSATSATNIRLNTANKKAFLNSDIPDKLPDMTALDEFGLAGLGYGPKLQSFHNDGATNNEVLDKKQQPAEREKDKGSSESTNNNNQNKKPKNKATKKDLEEQEDGTSSLFVGGGPSGSDRNVRHSSRSIPMVQPKSLNGIHMRDTTTNEITRDNHRESGRPMEAIGSRPQSAATLGQLLLRTAAYNESPIKDFPNWRTGIPPSLNPINREPLPLPSGAQQLERALAELAQDNQKQEERINRETKRNQKSEDRKEKSLLKALNRLHV